MVYANGMRVCVIHQTTENATFDEHIRDQSFDLLDHVVWSENGENMLQNNYYDLVIIDAVTYCSGDNDYALVRSVRGIKGVIPIFLITGDTVTAGYREHMLDCGVDGCVQIPFYQDELRLRLQKLCNKKDVLLFDGTTVEVEDIDVDIREHTVRKKGGGVNLTKTEYSILFHLMLHKNIPVSNDQLSLCLDQEVKEHSSAVNIHILNLRKKLGSDQVIRTIPHYGFLVADRIFA